MGQTLVTQPKFDLSPSNFDLTTEDLRILASKLQVEQKVALAETLAYSATCKLSRESMSTQPRSWRFGTPSLIPSKHEIVIYLKLESSF